MKSTITQAIALYNAGHLQQCLELIKPFTESAQARSARAYYRAGAIAPNPLVPYQWLGLATDRLQKELGQDVIAVVPVLMSLNTALASAKDD